MKKIEFTINQELYDIWETHCKNTNIDRSEFIEKIIANRMETCKSINGILSNGRLKIS